MAESSTPRQPVRERQEEQEEEEHRDEPDVTHEAAYLHLRQIQLNAVRPAFTLVPAAVPSLSHPLSPSPTRGALLPPYDYDLDSRDFLANLPTAETAVALAEERTGAAIPGGIANVAIPAERTTPPPLPSSRASTELHHGVLSAPSPRREDADNYWLDSVFDVSTSEAVAETESTIPAPGGVAGRDDDDIRPPALIIEQALLDLAGASKRWSFCGFTDQATLHDAIRHGLLGDASTSTTIIKETFSIDDDYKWDDSIKTAPWEGPHRMLLCHSMRRVIRERVTSQFIVYVYHTRGRLWTIHHPNCKEDEEDCRELRAWVGAGVTVKCGERLPFVDLTKWDEFTALTLGNAERFIKQQVYMSQVERMMQPGGGFAIHIRPYRTGKRSESWQPVGDEVAVWPTFAHLRAI